MGIAKDQIVSILYEVKDAQSGELIDSNINGNPLTFIIGRGQLIIGLENALYEMAVNERKEVFVEAANAYGIYNEGATQTLPIEQFEGIQLEEGLTLQGQSEDGQAFSVRVKSFSATDVVVDFNHPLAGKDLIFSVEVTAIRDANADELSSGIPAENQNFQG
jgi:FKBP-type peptidyl-prolyl cis-trans isomerase SlyD